MKKIFILISFCLLVTSTESCREKYLVSHDQEIIFQMDYVNHAWGYQHYGFMIDNRGRVLTYDNPEKWNFADDNFILTEKQIDENISMCRISDEKIPVEELRRFSSYIDKIASSKLTAMRNTGADAGTMQFICYKFSENSLMYKGFIIKTEGDFTAENLNFYSKKVVSWMKDIDQTVVTR
jgi:hypothetical protein